jgi:hypothetical protein
VRCIAFLNVPQWVSLKLGHERGETLRTATSKKHRTELDCRPSDEGGQHQEVEDFWAHRSGSRSDWAITYIMHPRIKKIPVTVRYFAASSCASIAKPRPKENEAKRVNAVPANIA